MTESINYIAVVVAAVAAMIVGWVWYGPLFGNIWMQMTGRTKEQIKAEGGMAKSMVVMLIASLVTAYVLGFFIKMTDSYSAGGGVKIAFWVWLGFLATTGLSKVMFEKKPFKLYLIDVVHYLIAFVVMGAILGAWH